MYKLVTAISLASALVLSPSASAQGVDLASLPPIDQITAETDIRPFLAPGVPLGVVRAALRRAWVVDPKIRDFRGLQENAWDFNDPTGVPGFGRLEIASDVNRPAAPMFAQANSGRSH